MTGQITFDVLIAVFIAVGGSLLSIIAFFIKQLLSKINRIGISMTELDKKLAVLINDTKGYNDMFRSIEERIKELEAEVSKKSLSH